MEPNSITVDEKEYAQWLAQNNLADPLPKTEQQTDEVPAYVPREVDPNQLNQTDRDLATGLVAAAPYIAGTIGTGLAAKYVKDIIKAPGAATAVSGPVKPGPTSAAGVAPAAASTGPNLGVVSRLAQGAGTLLNNATPAMMLAAPYQMAAYEQAKIRANPSALGLESNPYAQMTRGQFATQGQAGAMNRRQAIGSQQYGGLTAEQQQMLEQDRINQAIRRKAASKVLGPVIPQGY